MINYGSIMEFPCYNISFEPLKILNQLFHVFQLTTQLMNAKNKESDQVTVCSLVLDESCRCKRIHRPINLCVREVCLPSKNNSSLFFHVRIHLL